MNAYDAHIIRKQYTEGYKGNERADSIEKEVIVSADAIQCQVYSISDIKLIIKNKILDI